MTTTTNPVALVQKWREDAESYARVWHKLSEIHAPTLMERAMATRMKAKYTLCLAHAKALEDVLKAQEGTQ